jgi:hypothetical protein
MWRGDRWASMDSPLQGEDVAPAHDEVAGEDVAEVVERIRGKFARSRARWKRASIFALRENISPRAFGKHSSPCQGSARRYAFRIATSAPEMGTVRCLLLLVEAGVARGRRPERREGVVGAGLPALGRADLVGAAG